jgi:hypothetical protein
MKKRSETRIKKSLLVDLYKKGFEQIGVTLDISGRGMSVATTEVLRKRSKLQIMLAAANEIFVVTGKVVWHIKKCGLHGENVPAGMGIRIEKASPEYLKFIASVKKGLPAKKKLLIKKRTPATPTPRRRG